MKSMDKGAVMSFIVHSADISHPTKTWELHEKWTAGLVEEFFRQGDAEKERGEKLAVELSVPKYFSTRFAVLATLRSRNDAGFAEPDWLYRLHHHSYVHAAFFDLEFLQFCLRGHVQSGCLHDIFVPYTCRPPPAAGSLPYHLPPKRRKFCQRASGQRSCETHYLR